MDRFENSPADEDGQPTAAANGGPGDAEAHEHDDDEEGEIEEIGIVAEDGMVYVYGSDWQLDLSPEEARELGNALLEAADEAEGMEGEGEEGEEEDEDEKEGAAG